MSAWSPAVRVMLRPATARGELESPTSGAWLAVRRPLGFALILASVSSLLTGRFSLLLVLSGVVNWAYVPLMEIVALAVVWRLGARTDSFPAAIDVFFRGHGAWSLWWIGFGAFYSSVTPSTSDRILAIWFFSMLGVIAWSCYVDYCFFRRVLGRTAGNAGWILVLHRLISWTGILFVLLGGPFWPGLIEEWQAL